MSSRVELDVVKRDQPVSSKPEGQKSDADQRVQEAAKSKLSGVEDEWWGPYAEKRRY